MKIEKLDIPGSALVHACPRADERGAFARWFCQDELSDCIGDRTIVNMNYSRTEDVGAVRGMHAQRSPALEMKLVRCTRGAVFDVIVDLRLGSPTFLHWRGETLSAENMKMFVVPEGVAHGFQVLEPGSEMLYLHTAFYAPDAEVGVRFDDPKLAIGWPMPATVVSERDRAHPLIDACFQGIS